jgi:hypothetical protein
MNTDARKLILTALGLSAFICVHPRFISCARAGTDSHFEKHWLSAQFYGEGANTGDFNHDGKPDVVSGPFIYDGPDFKTKHAFTEASASDPLGYSKNFLHSAAISTVTGGTTSSSSASPARMEAGTRIQNRAAAATGRAISR